MKRYAVILFIVFGSIPAAYSQTMSEVEQQIKTYLDAISYWRFEYNPEDTSFGHEVNKEDSVNIINEKLYHYINTVVVNVPGVVKRPPSLPDNADMKIVSSEDKKISIYSWDTHGGATKHFFNSIALYEADGSVKSQRLSSLSDTKNIPSSASELIEILNIQTGKEASYYLLISKAELSDKEMIKMISGISIKDGEWKDQELFYKEDHSVNISYLYDYMSNYDFEKMKEIHTVHLSKNGKKLYVPEVANNQMTGKWQVYNFDGSKFVYDTIE